MSGKPKRNRKKKRSLLVILLYIMISLFTIWLLMVLTLPFFYSPEKDKENARTDKINSSELKKSPSNLGEIKDEVSEKKDDKTSHGLSAGDELLPTMENLFQERELTIKNIDAVFENMKSPKEIQTSHSTFGKEVVYIYSTHSREAFLPYLKDVDAPEEAYHSKVNITLVGKMLGRALEQRGVGTMVDSTDIVQVLDSKGLDFTSSYQVSGEQVQSARSENNELEFFLDIHRDSLRKDTTTVEMNGSNYANLLFVVGTGHKDFEKNLAFAENLQTALDARYPALSKGIIQKDSSQGNGIYNQDISPNAIIVEIGGVDNTAEEFHRSTEALADVFSDYYWHKEE